MDKNVLKIQDLQSKMIPNGHWQPPRLIFVWSSPRSLSVTGIAGDLFWCWVPYVHPPYSPPFCLWWSKYKCVSVCVCAANHVWLSAFNNNNTPSADRQAAGRDPSPPSVCAWERGVSGVHLSPCHYRDVMEGNREEQVEEHKQQQEKGADQRRQSGGDDGTEVKRRGRRVSFVWSKLVFGCWRCWGHCEGVTE